MTVGQELLKVDALEALKEDTKQDGSKTYYGVRALYALKEMAKNDVWPDWRFGDNDCNAWSLFHTDKES
jgi:hypothetical protein